MAKSYVKFEVTKEVSDKALEAVRLAKKNGAVKKGINEVTKSVERGLSSLVVIASDVEPEEVVMHLPGLCEQRKIPFTYVPAKLDIGKALGINVPCSAASIEKAGEGEAALKDVVARITGKAPAAKEHQPQAPKPEKEATTVAKPKEQKKEQKPK